MTIFRRLAFFVLLNACVSTVWARGDPKSDGQKKREEARAALDEIFTNNNGVVSIQNDAVQVQLYAQSDLLMPKAAKLSQEIRDQVDSFVVQDPAISEVGLKAILSFQNVEYLHLNDVKKWKTGFEPLMTGLPKLKSVWAQGMGLTNKELVIICKTKGLECLMIDGNKLTPGACKPLIELDELRQLALSGSAINDEDILNLKDNRRFEPFGSTTQT